MNGPVTWDVIYMLAGVVAGVLGIWWRVESRVEKGDAGAIARIERLEKLTTKQHEDRGDEIIAVSKDLADYKLHATGQFASHAHLKEVEERLTGAIDRLTNRVEQLPTRLAEQLPTRFAEEFARITAKPGRRG